MWSVTATTSALSWWGPNEAANEKFSVGVTLSTQSYTKGRAMYRQGDIFFDHYEKQFGSMFKDKNALLRATEDEKLLLHMLIV